MLFLYHQEIKDLREDLKTFGLNPKEWNLIRESKRTYRIESSDDNNFVFRGSPKKPQNRWEKIEILSL